MSSSSMVQRSVGEDAYLGPWKKKMNIAALDGRDLVLDSSGNSNRQQRARFVRLIARLRHIERTGFLTSHWCKQVSTVTDGTKHKKMEIQSYSPISTSSSYGINCTWIQLILIKYNSWLGGGGWISHGNSTSVAKCNPRWYQESKWCVRVCFKIWLFPVDVHIVYLL